MKRREIHRALARKRNEAIARGEPIRLGGLRQEDRKPVRIPWGLIAETLRATGRPPYREDRGDVSPSVVAIYPD